MFKREKLKEIAMLLEITFVLKWLNEPFFFLPTFRVVLSEELPNHFQDAHREMFPCLLPFFVISHHISNFLDIP
jgi:hypothetical protein